MFSNLRALFSRMKTVFRRNAVERELDAEIDSHLRFAIEDNLSKGMSAEEAQRQARIRFGGPQQSKESHRDARGLSSLEAFGRDLLFSLRALRKAPVFTVGAVLTLALGIGANSAIFSVANAVLLRDPAYRDPRQLVLLWGTGRDSARDQLSFTDIDDYRAQNHSFENIVAFGNWSATFIGNGTPERINGMQVADRYFSMMGAKFFLGREFNAQEQIPGKDNVIILTSELWKRRFGSDLQIVGKQVRLNSKIYVVVGVTAGDFPMLPSTLVDGHAQFYRPVAEVHDDKERSSRHLRAIARLRSGATMASAQSELKLINQRLALQFPEQYAQTGIRTVRLGDDLSADLKPALLLLSGGIAFLLLIACANVSNLLLTRAIGRQNELAIRSAVGARRIQLIRQILAECLLLALLGGLSGGGLAFCCTRLIVALGSGAIPQLASVPIDSNVLVFTFSISLATGLIFGLLPAWQASSAQPSEKLRDNSRGSTAPHQSLRNILAVTEIALALVLLAGAGLLIRSFAKLYSVDRGFRTDHILTMDVSLPQSVYPENSPKPIQFYRTLVSQVSELPGVEAAGAVSILPLGINFDTAGTDPEGFPHNPGDYPFPERYVVNPGYFQSMGLHLIGGRFLAESDTEASPLVALISQTAARRWWPGQDPIGRRIMTPDFGSATPPWRTVVGVVQDVKQAGLDAAPTEQIYLPHSQYAIGALTLVVRTQGDPTALTNPMLRKLAGIDANVAASNVATMDQVLANSVASRRFSVAILGALAGLGLILSSIGVYGVLSYGVLQRTREFGIRMAIGASRKSIVSLVVGQGARLLFAGLAIGLIGAFLLTRLMTSLLFGISANDPATYFAIIVFLSLSALLACFIPGRRASRVDPAIALRHE